MNAPPDGHSPDGIPLTSQGSVRPLRFGDDVNADNKLCTGAFENIMLDWADELLIRNAWSQDQAIEDRQILQAIVNARRRMGPGTADSAPTMAEIYGPGGAEEAVRKMIRERKQK